MKAMNSTNSSSSTPLNNNYLSKPRTYPPRDLSHIKCFTCGEMGHYASLQDREQAPPVTIRVDPLKAVPANMVQVLENYYQPEENLFSAPVIRKGRVEKAAKKPRLSVNLEKLQQAAWHHIDAFDERLEDMVPTRILQNLERLQPLTTALSPPILKTKTRKVQELVQVKIPSRENPIRGMELKSWFEINKILDTPIVLKIGKFLDCSDVVIKEPAYGIQRSTPRYRVKKSPIHKADQQMAAHVAAQELQMGRILLDGESMIALINKELVNKMTPRPPIYRDSRVKISLANDASTTLSEFVKIPVNVQGVETVIRAWLVDMKVYDLLLGVSWMRRVNCMQFYGEGRITIMSQDPTFQEVPMPVMLLSMYIPEFELAGLG
ncbi:hypothetical protein MMC31_003633 [Peltigera leucophlebia]|nr:hypothetical protein [Peltigera leucophlebia]